MKKFLAGILVVLTLVCVLSVAGCVKKEPSPVTTTATTTVANGTTVTTTTATTTSATTTTTTTPDPSTTTTTIPPTSDHDCFPDEWYGFDGVRVDNPDNWKKVVNGVFTSDKGGLQIRAQGWKTYGLYSISMVPVDYANVGSTNAICVSVYDPDSEDVFANKTITDFETVLGVSVDSLTKTTVDGYPAYKAVSEDTFYVWVINTPNYKYFINFMQAPDAADMEAIAEEMMAEGNVLVFK